MQAEKNGHALFHQLDDLDKDGIWDELFFQLNIKANSSKTIYFYLGENARGWNKHFTHANIGSYCRHQMPFWESENVGWKIWFANCCDVFAKRKPVLMSYYQGLSYLELKNKTKAREIFNALIESGEKRINRSEEDTVEYFAIFGEREDENTRISRAYTMRGLGHKGLGNSSSAREDLRKALELSASNLWAKAELDR